MAREEKDAASVPSIRAEVFASDPGFLIRVGKRIHDFERDALGRQPLTPPQFAILLAATRVPGSDQATIAYLSTLDTSTTSEVIRRLSRQRQIVVHRDPDDGRRSLIFVSESAAAQVESYLEKLESADMRVFSWLTEEDRAPFLEALRALAYHEASDAVARVPVTRIRWAVTETNHAFGRLIRIIVQGYAELWKQSAAELTPVQHEVLRVLRTHPGISQNLTGEVLYLDRATIATIVSRLAVDGLVSSRISEVDRRRKYLSLTPAGVEADRRLMAVRNKVGKRFLSPIGPGQAETLLRGLNRIMATAEGIGAEED